MKVWQAVLLFALAGLLAPRRTRRVALLLVGLVVLW
jgi:hypothetical protein